MLPVGKRNFLQVDGEMEPEVHYGVTILIYRIHIFTCISWSPGLLLDNTEVPNGLGFWASFPALALSGKVNLSLII